MLRDKMSGWITIVLALLASGLVGIFIFYCISHYIRPFLVDSLKDSGEGHYFLSILLFYIIYQNYRIGKKLSK